MLTARLRSRAGWLLIPVAILCACQQRTNEQAKANAGDIVPATTQQTAAAAPPVASGVVFPKGGRVGLVPPPSMTEASGFAGFADNASGASIMIAELPDMAYAPTVAQLDGGGRLPSGMSFKTAGATVSIPGATEAKLYHGTQTVPAGQYAKWILLAHGSGIAATVSAQAPSANAERMGPAIEAALRSVALRSTATANPIGQLPFKIGDLEGFRLVRTLGGSSALLMEGPADTNADGRQPMVIVAASLTDAPIGDRAAAARKTFATVPDLSGVNVTAAGPGATAADYRIAATATHRGRPIVIVQHMLFGDGGGYIRAVCTAPAQVDIAPRCDRLAGSIERTKAAASAPRSGAVFDRAGVLDAQVRDRLARKLYAFEQRTGHGLIVVTTPSLAGRDVATVGSGMLQQFVAAAKGRSDVIILLVAPKEHKVRIAVGQGLAAAVSDAFCTEVIDRDLLPAFRRGQFGSGVEAGVSRLTDRIAAADRAGAAQAG